MEVNQSHADFMTAKEIATRTGYNVKSIYNQHAGGGGPLSPILTRFGGRLGAWRADYDQFVSQQRRLDPRL